MFYIGGVDGFVGVIRCDVSEDSREGFGWAADEVFVARNHDSAVVFLVEFEGAFSEDAPDVGAFFEGVGYLAGNQFVIMPPDSLSWIVDLRIPAEARFAPRANGRPGVANGADDF